MKQQKARRPRRIPTPPPTPGGASGGFAPALLRASLWGLAAALGAGLLLSLLGAGIALNSADPDALNAPISLAVLGLAALAGGFVSYRCCRAAPLLCGLATGTGLIGLFFLLTCLFPANLRDSWPSGLRWGLRGGMLAFCILGALIASYTPKRRRKRR